MSRKGKRPSLRSRAWALGVYGALACATGSSQASDILASPTTILACGRKEQALVVLPIRTLTRVTVRGETPSWLEVEESGVDVELDNTPAGAFKVTVPTRFGRFFIPIEGTLTLGLRRLVASKTLIRMTLHLHCNSSREDERIDWYRRAAAVSTELMPVPSGKPAEALAEDIARLHDTAKEPVMRALTVHLRAQNLYTANRTNEAAQAFAEAEAAWRKSADEPRALAARVGRVEELIRASKYPQALELIPAAKGGSTAQSYFAARLEASRCLVFRYLGRLREAAACYAKSITTLRALGEQTELASALLDRGDVLRQVQKGDAAERSALEARTIAEGPYAPLVRGRADLLLYDLLLDRGEVADALSHVRRSLDEFASIHASRWEANAMLRAAWLYVQFGAIEEARALIEEARSRLSEQSAPARVAAASMLSAEAYASANKVDDALAAARSAESTYTRLGMKVELDGARLLVADLLLTKGEGGLAEEEISARSRNSLAETPAWRILRARAALQRGDRSAARLLLEPLARQRLRFAQDVERIELWGRWLADSGQREEAQQYLQAAANRIYAAQNAVKNPLLAELLARNVAPLRALAIELMLQDADAAKKPTDADAAHRAWAWLPRVPHSTAESSAQSNSTDVAQFDRNVADALLNIPGRFGSEPVAAATRSLLNMMADPKWRRSAAHSRRDMVSLEDFQAKLADGVVYVAYFDANPRGALLWVTHDKALLAPAPSPADLSNEATTLIERVSRPETPLSEIDSAARKISLSLLASAPAGSVPHTILVEMGAELGSIPWAVLQWPGSSAPLVEETTASFVRVNANCCDETGARTSNVRVLLAPQVDGAQSHLTPLPGAAVEARLIQKAVAGAGLNVTVDNASTSAILFAALGQPGDWVHIAGHGQTRADRIGYSGLWIESSETGEPMLISGFDLFDKAVRSELVVLGSCELAWRAPDAVRPTLNFADAVSRAGARNVIAALWPISDSATAVWVPAFYRAASSGESPDFGRALREGQLELRRSRRYRHPYYWAAFVHTAQLAPGALRSSRDVLTSAPTRGALIRHATTH